MIKLKSLIKEYIDTGGKDDDYIDVRTEMQQEFESGQKYQSWKLVPARDLLLIWAKFAKFGRVEEEEILKIWNMVKETALKIIINSEVWNGNDTDFFGVDSYEKIPEREENRHAIFISDRSGNKYVRNWAEVEGNARYSDAYQALFKLLVKAYKSKTPEELLMGIDTILNFVHGLGPMARWFVEGGVDTLGKIRDFEAQGIRLSGKLSEAKTNPRLGLCYELSGRYVSGHPEAILVHGRLTNRFERGHKEIEHAWVEEGNKIFDPVMDKVWPKETYEGVFNVKVYKKYTHIEVLKMTLEYKNWGPWDST